MGLSTPPRPGEWIPDLPIPSHDWADFLYRVPVLVKYPSLGPPIQAIQPLRSERKRIHRSLKSHEGVFRVMRQLIADSSADRVQTFCGEKVCGWVWYILHVHQYVSRFQLPKGCWFQISQIPSKNHNMARVWNGSLDSYAFWLSLTLSPPPPCSLSLASFHPSPLGHVAKDRGYSPPHIHHALPSTECAIWVATCIHPP